MNITLWIVILLIIWEIIRGYKKGMAKELSGLIALTAAFLVLALFIMLSESFKAGESVNTFYSVLLLIVFGIVYGAIKIVLKSAKAVSHLPILHFFDCVLGIGVGIFKAVLIIWIFFLFLKGGYFGEFTDIIQEDIQGSSFLKTIYQYIFFIG